MNLDGLPIRGDDGEQRVPVVTIAGNVTWVKGKGPVRHDGKSEAALRVIPLPRFTADTLYQRFDEPARTIGPFSRPRAATDA